MSNTRRINRILVALLVALPIGWWVGEIHAQMGPQVVQGAAPGAGQATQVEGKITSVDPSGRMVTLDDGTQLTIPPTVNVQRETLKEGAIVKASFEDKGGQKVVTWINVRPGS
jgi:hypothetical protein